MKIEMIISFLRINWFFEEFMVTALRMSATRTPRPMVTADSCKNVIFESTKIVIYVIVKLRTHNCFD